MRTVEPVPELPTPQSKHIFDYLTNGLSVLDLIATSQGSQSFEAMRRERLKETIIHTACSAFTALERESEPRRLLLVEIRAALAYTDPAVALSELAKLMPRIEKEAK